MSKKLKKPTEFAELKEKAKRAMDRLEYLRVSGGETALRLISDAAFLVSEIHNTLHWPEEKKWDPKTIGEGQQSLAAAFLKTTAASSLDTSWQIFEAWSLAVRLLPNKEIEPEKKQTGVPTVSADPQLVAAIQEKYPAAEPSRVRMYAQFLTGLRKNKESFNEMEQMVPQSYVKSLGLA